MKTPRGTSESSTTSDNTTEFIDIVKKYDVVYNTHNENYKNQDYKLKVWSQIAEEIGLSVDASKRKWKNLRDSYTKYLRSFRIGTKTSKKYQYWAHAEHMEFLKPYQGPGRNSNNVKPNDDDDTECDLGYQVLTKASGSEEDLKTTLTVNATTNAAMTMSDIGLAPPLSLTATNLTTTSAAASALVTTASNGGGGSGALVLPVSVPMPSLPTVQLPPPLACKPVLAPISSATLASAVQQSTHIFPLPSLVGPSKSSGIPIPTTSTASSVGCLIIEPQLFATADALKKELNLPALGVLHSIAAASSSAIASSSSATTTTAAAASTHTRVNPPLVTKIRRVQPSTKTSAHTLSSANSMHISSSAVTAAGNHPPPPKSRKVPETRLPDVDINTILQAARELDANTLFFLSLARAVRAMPTKHQSVAKMRCMRIVSDIEVELDTGSSDGQLADSPQATSTAETVVAANDAGTEHFVYVMSPSRVESMIDISSDEDATQNGN